MACVQIVDVNDPPLLNSVANFTMYEMIPLDTVVYTVQAFDEDVNDTGVCSSYPLLLAAALFPHTERGTKQLLLLLCLT